MADDEHSSDGLDIKSSLNLDNRESSSLAKESRANVSKTVERPKLRSPNNYASTASLRGSRHVVLGSRDHLYTRSLPRIHIHIYIYIYTYYL